MPEPINIELTWSAPDGGHYEVGDVVRLTGALTTASGSVVDPSTLGGDLAVQVATTRGEPGTEQAFTTSSEVFWVDVALKAPGFLYARAQVSNAQYQGAEEAHIAVRSPYIPPWGAQAEGIEGDTEPPDAVSSVGATVSGQDVTLSWTEPPETDYARVLIERKPSGGVYAPLQYVAKGTTSYVNLSVPYDDYTYRLTSEDETGNTGPAVTVAVTVADTQPPTTVSSLQGAINGNNEPRLTWVDPTDNVGLAFVRVYRDGSAHDQVAPSVQLYDDTSATEGVEYTYDVRGVDGAGNEAPASNTVVLTAADTTPPGVPTLDNLRIPSGTLYFDVTAPSDDDVQGIEMEATGPAGTFIKTYAMGPNDGVQFAFFLVEDPEMFNEGETHTGRVRAYDDKGNYSPWTDPQDVVATDITAPPVPTSFTATGATESSVTLAWNHEMPDYIQDGTIPDDFDAFVIYRGTDPGPTTEYATTGSTSYTDSNVSTGTQYYYRVRARDTEGNLSPYSATRSAKPQTNEPPTVGNVAVGARWSWSSFADLYPVGIIVQGDQTAYFASGEWRLVSLETSQEPHIAVSATYDSGNDETKIYFFGDAFPGGSGIEAYVLPHPQDPIDLFFDVTDDTGVAEADVFASIRDPSTDTNLGSASSITRVSGDDLSASYEASFGSVPAGEQVVRAQGFDGAGQEGVDDTAVSSYVPVGVPTNVAAADITTEAATVSWDAVTDADGYNVYYSSASGGPYTQANSSLITGTEAALSGLTADTTYYVVVRSVVVEGGVEYEMPPRYDVEASFDTLPALPAFTASPDKTLAGANETFTFTRDSAASNAGYLTVRLVDSGGNLITSWVNTTASTNPSVDVSLPSEFEGTNRFDYVWTRDQDGATKDSDEKTGSTPDTVTVDATAAVIQSVVLAADGTTVTINANEDVTRGVGHADSDLALNVNGSPVALTYSSGDGTSNMAFTAASAVNSGDSLSLDYTQPGDGLEDDAGNDLASFTGLAVTNNSTQASYIQATQDYIDYVETTNGGTVHDKDFVNEILTRLDNANALNDLVLFLAGEAGSDADVGQDVSVAYSADTNRQDHSQSTGADQPAMVQSASFNNRRVFSFDGAGDYLSDADFDHPENIETTFIAVPKANSAIDDRLYYHNADGGNRSFEVRRSTSPAETIVKVNSNDGLYNTIFDNQLYYFTYRRDGSNNERVWVNNTEETDANTGWISGVGTSYIAWNGISGSTLELELALLLRIDSALDAATIEDIRSYCYTYYGINP